MELVAYASVDEIPNHICILSANLRPENTNNANAWFAKVKTLRDGHTTWLRVRFAEFVLSPEHIILPESTFGFLQGKTDFWDRDLRVTIELIEQEEIDHGDSLIISLSPVSMKASSSDQWSFSSSMLNSTMKTSIISNFGLLAGLSVLDHQSIFVCQYLGAFVAFRVSLSDTQRKPCFVGLDAVVSIVDSSNTSAESLSTSSTAVVIDANRVFGPIWSGHYHYLAAAHQRASYEFKSMISTSSSSSSSSSMARDDWSAVSRVLHQNLLFLGPRGIGKSFFLQSLFQYFVKESKEQGTHNVEILSLNCRDIVQRKLRPPSSLIHSEVTIPSIIDTLRHFASTTHTPSEPSASDVTTILLIDQLDDVFSLFAEESLQERTALDDVAGNNTLHHLAFLLYHLLMQLKVSRMDHLQQQQQQQQEQRRQPLPPTPPRILVIGAARFHPQALPRSSSGCPEFASVMSLPKPTSHDRQRLWQCLLHEYATIQTLRGQDSTTAARSTEPVLSLKWAGSSSSVAAAAGSPIIECDTDEWVNHLAQGTRGYVAGDLWQVLSTAVNASRREAQSNTTTMSSSYSNNSSNNSSSNAAKDITVTLTWDMLVRALADVTPSSLLEFSTTLYPDLNASLTWDHFVGYAEAKQQAQRIAKMIRYKSSPEKGGEGEKSLVGSKRSKGMVVYGASGCGKSHLVRVMAKEMHMNFVEVTGADLLSKYFGDTEARIRSIFQRARSASPCILYFDNFDTLAHRRGADEGSMTSGGNIGNRILSTFLNELDGIGSEANVHGDGDNHRSSNSSAIRGGSTGGNDADEHVVFVVVSCSDIEKLDEALVRPGRLQHHVRMGHPTKEDTQALLAHFFHESPVDSEVDWSELASLIHQRGQTTAYIEKHLSVTRLLALRDEVITTVIQDYLTSHPHIASELQRLSDVMLSGESYQIQHELVTVNDVAAVTIRLHHLIEVIHRYFPEEKSLFSSSPFGGTFTFNVGSSMY